ncbi:TonB-dependent receptor domain-containing protein [Sphingobium aquiterrae]|uniref:TonB-dependent receptor domain-containing protein n=1 Tax=Sphingobium aquiterrae TaxID=2038656 RepID=UPI003016B77E
MSNGDGRSTKSKLLTGAALLYILTGPGWAMAQDAAQAPAARDAATPPENGASSREAAQSQEITVTGSRIRTSDTTTPAPVTIISPAVIEERGFTQIGQALNEIPSITPSYSRNTGIGSQVTVQNYPNLFNLGAGRTLSLVNGRRMVTTGSGLEDAAVDTNIIPLGLIDRVDVVQGGGAAVYGSGAMAGVINYVLKRNFQGMVLDGQYSISSHGDYPVYSLRGTFGTNFKEGRGNIAVNVDYSKSDALLFPDREASRLVPFPGTNPANKTGTDGIPATVYFTDTKTWSSSYNGMFWANTGTTLGSLLKVNGNYVQFNQAGTALVPYDTGTVVFSNLAQGGDGVAYNSKSTLFAGIERLSGTMVGHYDLTDNITVSTELLYARTVANDPLARMRPMQFDNTGSAAGGTFSFAVYRDNAYLAPAVLSQLSAASPSFAAGGPLYLGKFLDNIMPDTNLRTDTKTYRGLLALDGKFEALDRQFNWSASVSRARVDTSYQGWNLNQIRLRNAADAVRNSAGQTVCRINQLTVTDPNCVPINLFGHDNITEAARSYVTVQSGTNQSSVLPNYVNDQTDALLSFSGDVVKLPGGMAKFNLTYEYRQEKVDATPLEADRLGLIGAGSKLLPFKGGYHTNEIAGELLIPLVGEDFTLPLVDSFEINGSYRLVNDSLAGRENVWGLGARWGVFRGLTIRSSLSRNFRAPNLNQLLQPQTTAVATATNPCSNASIASGSNPTARYNNCLALFQANPTYGATDALPAGSPAAARLAGFFDLGGTFRRVLVTTGGNPDLKNETSQTFTLGFVFQPGFIPGLTLTADRIRLSLDEALSSFSSSSFLSTCFDSPNPAPSICSTFSFNPDGTLASARATTFNAGYLKYHGEIYTASYRADLADLFGARGNIGTLTLSLQATHNTLRITSVTGLDIVRIDDTTSLPRWVWKPDVRYAIGPFRLSYSAYILPAEKINYTDTVENASVLPVAGNTRHNISAEVTVDRYTLRAGINNFTNKQPSFPYSAGYGDIIGRQFFVGVKAAY